MIDDLGLADERLAESDWTTVLSVAQHQDHRPPFPIVRKLPYRLIDGAPQGCRRVRSDERRQRASKFVQIVGEGGADRDLAAECPHSRHVIRGEAREKLF